MTHLATGRALALAAFVTCGLMAGGTTSAFASGWAVKPSPNPGGYNDVFNGVSCATAGGCLAVGETINGFALSERWSRGHWTAVHTARPSGAIGTVLTGVSCASANSCTAVGSYSSGGGSAPPRPLAEHWNGHRWSTERTASPAGGGELDAVSCASARACVAVGGQGRRALVERWNGRRWSIVRVRLPARAEGAFRGVSCASSHACTAVGAGHDGRPLIAGWDGRHWMVESVAGRGALTSVSCVAAMSCTAVGVRGDAPLAEYWNGNAWSSEHAAVGTGTTESLQGISCSAAHTCTAVGVQQTPGGPEGVLAERFTGGHWSVQSAPGGSLGAGLSGVSCPSAHSCTAVGEYFGQIEPNSYPITVSYTLAERWTG